MRLPCIMVDRAPAGQPDIWQTAYVPALRSSLKLTDGEVDVLNLCRDRSSLHITQNQFSIILSSPYLIIDVTHPSHRTLLLLGYAIANKKRIILLRANEPSIALDIVDYPTRVYDGAESLKTYLLHIVQYEDSRAAEAAGQVNDFLSRCGFPLLVLEGDAQYDYSLHRNRSELPIQLVLDSTAFQPPEPWRDVFSAVLERERGIARSSGAVFFNGELLRLKDYTPLRDETIGTRGMRLDVQKTDYFTFASSNHCWDFVSIETAEKLRALESSHLSSLRNSVLANPLTVSISLVVRDGGKEWFLIQRRNTEKTFHGKYDFQCAASGMVSLTRDERSGVIDVYSTACNELREETGIWVGEDQVSFLALLRETRSMEIGLVGEVTLEDSAEKLLSPRADTFETTGFLICEATPSAFGDFLRRNGPRGRFGPLSAAAIIFSLLRRYSVERVGDALAV